MTETVGRKDNVPDNTIVDFAALDTELGRLFVLYSRLLGIMHETGLRDFIDTYVKYRSIRIILYFITMSWFHDRVIAEMDTFNRKIAIGRIRNFLDTIDIYFADIERSKSQNLDEVKEIHKKLTEFQSKLPEYPKGVTIYQVAPLVSAIVAVILLGINLFGDSLAPYSNQVTTIGLFGAIGIGGWLFVSIFALSRESLWYFFMSVFLHIRTQEREVLKELRPLVRYYDYSLLKKTK